MMVIGFTIFEHTPMATTPPPPPPPNSSDGQDNDEPENYPFRRDDTELQSNDLESVDLVQCPRCHKYCLSVYDQCPRCRAALASATVNRQPLWFVLTVAVILGMIVFYWVLQLYSLAPIR